MGTHKLTQEQIWRQADNRQKVNRVIDRETEGH